jgi:hypothetical protein
LDDLLHSFLTSTFAPRFDAAPATLAIMFHFLPDA